MSKQRQSLREQIREAIKEVYKYSLSGSALHIVLDDMNTETHYIKWCIKNSIPQIENEAEREACERCAELLLKAKKIDRDDIILSIY